METKYQKVKNFEYNLHIHSYNRFSREVALFDEMMELYLEPLDEIGRAWHGKDEKSPEIVLLARMFNDFESSRLLLINGQPEQAV